MRCPLCDVSMKEIDRRGVEVDICPECKGVWLDRGELDKLLAAAPQYEREYAGRRDRDRRRDDDDGDDDEGGGLGGLLSNLFNLGD
ncbi:MAG: zf-TFIIB domain-containing protein [Dehalococcoidia bacterium]